MPSEEEDESNTEALGSGRRDVSVQAPTDITQTMETPMRHFYDATK